MVFLYHLVSALIATPHRYAVVIIDADHRFDVTRLLASSSCRVPSPNAQAVPQERTTGECSGESIDVVNAGSLPATKNDLHHLYVYRPAPSSPVRRHPADNHALLGSTSDQVQAYVAAARDHMLYGEHASRDRRWWGTIVVDGGGGGGGGEINAGWKGWMEVQRREAPGFAVGISVQEALEDRERRHQMTRQRGWEGRTRVGKYVWGEGMG
jgi:hypothetical protein